MTCEFSNLLMNLKFSYGNDLCRRAKKEGIESCVIDAEVVAWDRERGCLLPFQVLSTRKRKVEDGEEDNQKVINLKLSILFYNFLYCCRLKLFFKLLISYLLTIRVCYLKV